MKVNIEIYSDDGVAYSGEGLEWSEACTEICNQYIIEQIHNIIFHEDFQMNFMDTIQTQLINKEETKE